MKMNTLIVVGWAFVAAAMVRADEPPMIPVGLDAYRLWERWPYQRIGARAYMRSTYECRRQRGGRRQSLPLPAGRRLQRHARRRGSWNPVLRPLQPLAWQPLALRSGRQR